ncbi:hypothetical protein UFOVP236_13 [uncultured Caudovirales phage]|uniref:Uncharacterized protein n=1 Tax=uncultured Caudovirales phage TaxID=2100421 RepID=A0A6J7WVU9_9CAUD|nr:hypothetical protein UFOVP236_13 [uncultured Caudovirales phage]
MEFVRSVISMVLIPLLGLFLLGMFSRMAYVVFMSGWNIL